MSKMTFRVVNVTPVMAFEWLKRNRKNRAINRSHVARLSRDMAAGRWVATPQPIIFDVDGDLIDGQHRLTAIVDCGVAVQSTVCDNAPRESLRGIDMGAARQADGILRMLHGVTASKREIATSNAMAEGMRLGPTGFTKQELAEFFLEHQEAVRFVVAAVPPSAGKAIKSSVGAAIGRAYYSVDRDVLLAFCEVLTTGITKRPADATVVVLRDFIMASVARGSSSAATLYRKTARALDAYRKGEVLGRLFEATKEPFPLPGETPKRRLDAAA